MASVRRKADGISTASVPSLAMEGPTARLARGTRLTALAWVVGGLVTGLIALSPFLSFGFRSPSLHLVLDTVDACVAGLAAYLLHGRWTRNRRSQDLLLSQSLVLLALAGGGLAPVVSAVTDRPGTVDVWLPLLIRVAGAGWLLAAALAGATDDRRPGNGAGPGWVWPMGLVVVAMAAAALLRDHVPVALDPAYVPASAQHPVLAGHPLLLAAHTVSCAAFLLASLLFARQSARRSDELLRWLGPACALGGFARLSYLLFPSLYSDWLYAGDVLRTGCYLVLLVGAARELARYWGAQARVAVLEDRRRLARELHDSVIQELGLIRAESYRLPADHASTERISAAAERALGEARAAVHALGRPAAEPLGFALHRAVRDLADRHRVDVEIDVDDTIAAGPDQQHALLRITREAIENAVRHGRAQRIEVRLAREDGSSVLTVADDGRGFDPAEALARPLGFGLVSMRERAALLPGSMTIAAEPQCGSAVTVRW